MEWYCAVWNSDKVSNVMGAQFLYEQLCQGEDSLVGDIGLIDEFFEDLISNGEKLDINILLVLILQYILLISFLLFLKNIIIF